jgi:uncharacterized protein (UPF0305 family)
MKSEPKKVIHCADKFYCPVCENEELKPMQGFCQICGQKLEWPKLKK